jgi:bacillithiol biosynthesis deacetylase BshB1
VNAIQAGVDCLCIAPHTDDAELALGGTLRLLADRGRAVWVCDLTRGELASNATPEERWGEAEQASEILGLTGRLQLGLPDGFVAAADPDQIGAVTSVIRRLRPRWIVVAPEASRHPDHLATPALVAKALFMANLSAYEPAWPDCRIWPEKKAVSDLTEGDPTTPWRSEALLVTCAPHEQPALIFDCSAVWEKKRAAIAAYRSQFQRDAGRRPTLVNSVAWHEEIERRGQQWGFKAGVAYGEALRSQAVPVLRDLPEEPWA